MSGWFGSSNGAVFHWASDPSFVSLFLFFFEISSILFFFLFILENVIESQSCGSWVDPENHARGWVAGGGWVPCVDNSCGFG